MISRSSKGNVERNGARFHRGRRVSTIKFAIDADLSTDRAATSSSRSARGRASRLQRRVVDVSPRRARRYIRGRADAGAADHTFLVEQASQGGDAAPLAATAAAPTGASAPFPDLPAPRRDVPTPTIIATLTTVDPPTLPRAQRPTAAPWSSRCALRAPTPSRSCWQEEERARRRRARRTWRPQEK